MADIEPGDRITPRPDAPAESGRPRLEVPPSSRYVDPRAAAAVTPTRSGLTGPLLRATIVAAAGAALLTLVGAILASTFGLLFVAGAMGGTIGLVLSRAAVPSDDDLRPTSRRTVAILALVLAVAAVIAADLATWRIALSEGGTLGLVDYLLTTFGPFVPGVPLVAALGAWWGAGAGPVQR